MNITSNINTTLQALEKLKTDGFTSSHQELFLSTMLSHKDQATMNLFSSMFTKENIFNKAIFSAIDNDNMNGLKTLSLMANLNGIQMLSRGSNQNNFDMLYDNYIQKEVINDLEEKLATIKENISKTEDKTLLSAYKQEYKIYRKVLEEYKEFQAEDEKVLAQMMQLKKGSALL